MVSMPPMKFIRTRSPAVNLAGFPDFLIAGPQRTGTTWIYRNLVTHPHLFLPSTKEIYYFSTLGKSEHPKYQFDCLEDYLRIFRESGKAHVKKTYDTLRRCGVLYNPRLIGEATATYATIREEIIAEIALLNPNIRVVLMLRDPVERTWSHAKKELLRRLGPDEKVAESAYREFFEQAGQVRRSAMQDVIDRWRAHLPYNQVYLGDYRHLCADPRRFLDDLCEFLGAPLPKRFNSPHLRSTINPTSRAAMPEALEAWLRERLANDLGSYRALLDDFDTHWRKNRDR